MVDQDPLIHCVPLDDLSAPRPPAAGVHSAEPPLCVDLDGTLIRSDILWESIMVMLRRPYLLVIAAWSLLKGKASFKAKLAESAALDPAGLPYREELLEHLRSERQRPRRLVLATASHRRIAVAVATHLKLFDDVLATEGTLNLSGAAKRAALEAAYGARGFDYIGDSEKDLPIFAAARAYMLADPSRRLLLQAQRIAQPARIFRSRKQSPLLTLLLTLRAHQWLKNVLLAVPLLAAHLVFQPHAWLNLLLAFTSFSLLASGTYVINDLHDLSSDRQHGRKRFRPLAAGDLPIPLGLMLAVGLIGGGLSLTLLLPRLFLYWLLFYLITTLAYSFELKRQMLIDVLILGGLYTVRIMAGAAAVNVPVSEWLLMFSLFLFVSLAILKRYVEVRGAEADEFLPGRGYMGSDLNILRSVGTTTGCLSVLILAMYINSSAVASLYRHPTYLWLLCPILLYWIMRIWFLAERGHMHHDPIVFAATDRKMYVLGLIAAVVVVLAYVP